MQENISLSSISGFGNLTLQATTPKNDQTHSK